MMLSNYNPNTVEEFRGRRLEAPLVTKGFSKSYGYRPARTGGASPANNPRKN
jgi:hypothetical protein